MGIFALLARKFGIMSSRSDKEAALAANKGTTKSDELSRAIAGTDLQMANTEAKSLDDAVANGIKEANTFKFA